MNDLLEVTIMITFLEYLIEAKKVEFNPSTMRWITIRDENNIPQKLLIKKKGGEVLGGMGGEHTGEKLSQVFDKEEKKPAKSKEEKGEDLKIHVQNTRVTRSRYSYRLGTLQEIPQGGI